MCDKPEWCIYLCALAFVVHSRATVQFEVVLWVAGLSSADVEDVLATQVAIGLSLGLWRPQQQEHIENQRPIVCIWYSRKPSRL